MYDVNRGRKKESHFQRFKKVKIHACRPGVKDDYAENQFFQHATTGKNKKSRIGTTEQLSKCTSPLHCVIKYCWLRNRCVPKIFFFCFFFF